MLHYIKGILAMKMETGIVVEAGGLGYEITVPANSSVYLAGEGEEITVYTAMIVREDDVSLYGFGAKAELDTFRKLITVSGVGAKAAIAILSAMPLAEVHQAIVLEDAKSLTRAKSPPPCPEPLYSSASWISIFQTFVLPVLKSHTVN